MFEFMWKIRNSFGKVKRDYGELKTNVDGWITFFDRKNKDYEKKMERNSSGSLYGNFYYVVVSINDNLR